MKKLILILFISTSFQLIAQRPTEVGFKIGPSYTIASGNLKSDYGKGFVRFHGGLYTREKLGKINIVFEALYNNMYVHKKDRNFEINSLCFPLMLEVNVFKSLSFQGGINPSFTLAYKKTALLEGNKDIKPLNMDFAAGINLKLSNKIGVNARFSYPLNNYSTNEDVEYKPMSAYISFNYLLIEFAN